MPTTLTREILIDIVKGLRERDPLLRDGIQLDWVCVINPAIVSAVKEAAKQYTTPYSPSLDGILWLDLILGRRTFIIEEANWDVEYMPESVMRSRYADHFKRVEEWLKSVSDYPPDSNYPT